MNKKLWTLFAVLIAFMLVLGACNKDTDEPAKGTDEGKTEEGKTEEGKTEETAEEPVAEDSDALFPLEVTNDGDAISGGILKVAMAKDEPFQGIFLAELSEDAYDSDIMAYSSNSLFGTDGDFLLDDSGIASMTVDQANNKVTIKIRDGVKWSDGEPLKIEDVIYPYLIIGSKGYTGVRYDSNFQNIVGAEEYHDGKADSISGLVKVDETTLEMSLKQISPAIFSGGDGIWSSAAPSHILKDIKMADLVESDAVRKNPVTLGAFKFDKIVPGESVQFVANENYWKGKPKLDGVLVKVVPTSSISVAIGQGEYDIASSFSASKMEEVKDFDNIDILGRQELYYSYLGFKLGKYDTEKGEVITDLAGSKMGDVKLRHAMGYAIDVEQVAEVFYNGLRERANSLIPPVFASFYDSSLEGFTFDPDKAMALLDEAGYKDTNGDGIREDKEGKPFEIKFATMTGDDIAEDITQFYLQNWKDVGLNVTLTTGRTIEFNSFYDKVQADDPEIDIFMAAWATGTDPSPMGLYSKSAQYNFSRFSSDFLEQTLANIDSPEAFDADYRAGQFRAWQEYMAEEAPVIPTMYRYELVPVNKRVKNWNIDYSNESFSNLQDVELVSDSVVKSSK
ncbi:oligopeptide ABC transporter substrate-binding protein [Psychrobacillus glaciei]|uniref:Oligopeptide ABC transporter substrate-binding protein n=1 Tax=Psychrobacillus glaciei TaxID=2283160 RepID=A0A5J6SK11_9BACI|nr:oligopeptide ABC transporter substrate-binding protein [Psychrobacillus glaciei]QFF98240.1 oligopeptide ABC transporter substrate-binding protein [Psychrobacillus glaciei]